MSMDEQHLKNLIKSSLAEVLLEKRDLFASMIGDVIEEMGLLRAMEEARHGETVSMEEVRSVLRSDS